MFSPGAPRQVPLSRQWHRRPQTQSDLQRLWRGQWRHTRSRKTCVSRKVDRRSITRSTTLFHLCPVSGALVSGDYLWLFMCSCSSGPVTDGVEPCLFSVEVVPRTLYWSLTSLFPLTRYFGNKGPGWNSLEVKQSVLVSQEGEKSRVP